MVSHLKIDCYKNFPHRVDSNNTMQMPQRSHNTIGVNLVDFVLIFCLFSSLNQVCRNVLGMEVCKLDYFINLS